MSRNGNRRSASARLRPAALAALAAACATCGAPSGDAVEAREGAVQEGKATWYSDSLAGNRTANGERYDPRAMTAAHRTLPFGTRVRVTNLRNGRSVVVRINDRGPFGRRERIIDMSRAAAESLGMIRAGVVPVRVEVIEAP